MSTVFSLNVNTKKIVFALDQLQAKAQREVERAAFEGMALFMGKIQKEQYTGRPGLKTRSAILKRAWRVWKLGTINGGNFAVKLVNNVIYGQIHDKSRKGDGIIKPKHGEYLWFTVNKKLVRAKQVKIPIRTDVVGDFNRSGRGIIIGKVSRALADLIERGLVI